MTNYSYPNISTPIDLFGYANYITNGTAIPMVVFTISLIILVNQIRKNNPPEDAVLVSSVVCLILSLMFYAMNFFSNYTVYSTGWLSFPIGFLILAIIYKLS